VRHSGSLAAWGRFTIEALQRRIASLVARREQAFPLVSTALAGAAEPHSAVLHTTQRSDRAHGASAHTYKRACTRRGLRLQLWFSTVGEVSRYAMQRDATELSACFGTAAQDVLTLFVHTNTSGLPFDAVPITARLLLPHKAIVASERAPPTTTRRWPRLSAVSPSRYAAPTALRGSIVGFIARRCVLRVARAHTAAARPIDGQLSTHEEVRWRLRAISMTGGVQGRRLQPAAGEGPADTELHLTVWPKFAHIAVDVTLRKPSAAQTSASEARGAGS
jgi:hypothetical protein